MSKPRLSLSRSASKTVAALSVLVPLGLFAACASSENSTDDNMTPVQSASSTDTATSSTAPAPSNTTLATQTASSTAPAGAEPTGPAEIPGATGSTGDTGDTGSTGSTGATGSTGDSGGTGASGAGGSGGSGASGAGGSGGTLGTPTASGPVGSGGEGGSDAAPSTGGTGGVETGVGGAMGTGGGADVPPGGEFELLEPEWTASEECTPEAKDACSDIPVENRATMIGGTNVMPTISWTAGPEGTKSYAIVYQDLSNTFAHYAMWNVPAGVTSVGPDNIPAAAGQAALVGMSWFGSGACDHVYQLGVYALSVESLDPMGTKQNTVRDQLDGDDGTLVLKKAFGRVTPKAPCN